MLTPASRFSIALVAALACLMTSCASTPTPSKSQTTRTTARPAATRTAKVAPEPTYRHVVAADHELASKAGLEMLERGGNAVDAAVAASFTLSVVRPYSCGIGGGGFMLIHLASHPRIKGLPRDIALDYRERAASWATPDAFTKGALKDDPLASTEGAHAVAIPGTVAGLLAALETYGTLPREVVLAPAIRAAEEGFAIDADHARVVNGKNVKGFFERHPEHKARFAEFRRIYDNGQTTRAGDILKQPEHAKALRLIAKDGAAAFYNGPITDAIRATLKADGADVPASDFASYTPKELTPLATTFRGRRVLTFPLPSSGGIVLSQVLGMIESRASDFDRFDYASADALHFLTEALSHSFADRSRHLADPDFVPVPVLALTSAVNIRDLASRIDMTRTQPAESYGSRLPSAGAQELRDAGTSHLSAVDSFGNAVACTETINLEFGSMLVVKGYGFVLNNQMDDFTTRPGKPNAFGLRQDERNLPAPGKQPLSSMSPTIVLSADRDDAPVELVVGASGGPRIITGTLQVLLDSIVYDIPASRAVAQPRIHHQWMPRTLTVEADLAGAPDAKGTVAQSLTKRGHEVKVGSSECVVQAVRRSPRERTRFEAGSDPRKGGKPAGQ